MNTERLGFGELINEQNVMKFLLGPLHVICDINTLSYFPTEFSVKFTNVNGTVPFIYYGRSEN